MPKAYQVFGEERTGPLLSIDSVPLVSPFSPFRKMFSVDKTARNVTRKTDMSVFWDELTVNAANGWNAQDVSLSLNLRLELNSYYTLSEIYRSVQA